MSGVVAGFLVFSVGALLLVWHRFAAKTPALTLRLARARAAILADAAWRRPSVEVATPP